MNKPEVIKSIYSEVGERVKIVAVSKTKPNEDILEVYNTGHKLFGENKVQDLVAKYEALPKDIEWHFIGHLQTNKVKYIAPFVQLIHAVDSLKLLNVIDKEAKKNHRIISCLLQMKIAEEKTKFGFSKDDVKALLESDVYKNMENIHITGLMGMATNTDDERQVKYEFSQLNQFFIEIRDLYFADKDYFSELSMGMSHDYMLAVEAGSTMVRIGSKIFGERVYN